MRPETHARALPGAGTLAFVAALAARHGFERRVPGVGRALHVGARRSLAARLTHAWFLHLSPAIQMHVAATLRAQEPRSERATAVSTDAASAGFPVGTLHRETLVTRLLERGARVSSVDILATQRIDRAVEEVHRTRREIGERPVRAARALPRILARGPRTSISDSARVRDTAPRQAPDVPVSSRPFAPARAERAVPPVNVAHLTRDVMRAIDERIVAHRERLGRT